MSAWATFDEPTKWKLNWNYRVESPTGRIKQPFFMNTLHLMGPTWKADQKTKLYLTLIIQEREDLNCSVTEPQTHL